MIAVSLPMHENPHVLLDLLSNIRKTYNRRAIIIVHLSLNTKVEFLKHMAIKGLKFDHNDLVFNDFSMETKWGNAFPMHASNYLHAAFIYPNYFTHFQIITPSNLVVGENIDNLITKNDILMNKAVPASLGWFWEPQSKRDQKFDLFRRHYTESDILCCRTEGFAVRFSLFGAFLRKVLDIYSFDDMRNIDYPMEETLIPTYFDTYIRSGYSSAPTASKTYEQNEKPITVDDVKSIVQTKKFNFVKRISPHPEDEVRRYIMSCRSYGKLL